MTNDNEEQGTTDKPGCETAADHGWGEDHFAKPWAMVARVSGLISDGLGNPIDIGEARVCLANYDRMKIPEAFEGCEPINLHILWPWGPLEQSMKAEALGGIHLSAKHARVLGQALIDAADRCESSEITGANRTARGC